MKKLSVVFLCAVFLTLPACSTLRPILQDIRVQVRHAILDALQDCAFNEEYGAISEALVASKDGIQREKIPSFLEKVGRQCGSIAKARAETALDDIMIEVEKKF